jgi:hypothetical protein
MLLPAQKKLLQKDGQASFNPKMVEINASMQLKYTDHCLLISDAFLVAACNV